MLLRAAIFAFLLACNTFAQSQPQPGFTVCNPASRDCKQLAPGTRVTLTRDYIGFPGDCPTSDTALLRLRSLASSYAAELSVTLEDELPCEASTILPLDLPLGKLEISLRVDQDYLPTTIDIVATQFGLSGASGINLSNSARPGTSLRLLGTGLGAAVLSEISVTVEGLNSPSSLPSMRNLPDWT